MLIDKNIYFVHIPRTGGRYVHDLLVHNQYTTDLISFKEYFNDKEVPHLTYPDYEIYLNFLNCKKFTIVRDPVNRFLSAVSDDAKLNEDTILKMLESQQTFDMYINNLIFHDSTNWYVPQTNFLNNNINIYKFEDGLSDNFYKWLYETLDLKIHKPYNINNFTSNKIELSNKQKQYIKNYYYKDYKLLGY